MSSHIPIFSFGEKEYPIHSEEELALILELLSSSKESYELHRYILMTLDEDLHCMRHLDHKNRFLLLVKIGDTLSHVIGKSEHL
jgi:hypothetical protein